VSEVTNIDYMKNHPIQPVENKGGCPRFKENKIVSHLLDYAQKHGCGLNEIAAMPFSREDRVQLAQLIGYSLSGFSELSYVSDDDYGAAANMAKGKDERDARIAHLEQELKAIRNGLRSPVARLFGIHPDDLKKP